MTTVESVGAQPAIQEPARRYSHPAGGFSAVLSQVQLRTAGGATVTLGQMAGLTPSLAPAFALGPATGTEARPAHPLVRAASAYIGVPYLWGGNDPAHGLDCSGLIQRAFADLGIEVPRVSADQARAGVAVDTMAEARPGDLVYWAGEGGRPNHIGIYLGDGKMLHAPRTGELVQVSDVRSRPPDAIRRIV